MRKEMPLEGVLQDLPSERCNCLRRHGGHYGPALGHSTDVLRLLGRGGGAAELRVGGEPSAMQMTWGAKSLLPSGRADVGRVTKR